jgi:hypothetical protein
MYKFEEVVGWTQLGQDIDGTTNSQLLGQAVALSSSGMNVVIGAQSSGESTLQRGETSIFLFVETMDINNIKKRGINFYPNPTNGLINIDFGNLNEVNLRVVDLNGKIVFQKDNIRSRTFQFDIQEASGLYFIEVYSENQKETFELLKE